MLAIPVLYLSCAIIRRKSEYYRLLLSVTREGEWEPWLLFMIDAVCETAQWTTTKVRAIREAPRIYSRELAEIIFVRPYCRIGNLVEAGIAQRQSASLYLKTLAKIGVLEELEAGRERLFINPRLLRLLTSDDARL